MFRSLALALLVSSATAYQFTNTSAVCNFTFSLDDLPNFRLPEAGPNSPGDVQLNVGNDIITRGWDESDGECHHRCGSLCACLLPPA